MVGPILIVGNVYALFDENCFDLSQIYKGLLLRFGK